MSFNLADLWQDCAGVCSASDEGHRHLDAVLQNSAAICEKIIITTCFPPFWMLKGLFQIFPRASHASKHLLCISTMQKNVLKSVDLVILLHHKFHLPKNTSLTISKRRQIRSDHLSLCLRSPLKLKNRLLSSTSCSLVSSSSWKDLLLWRRRERTQGEKPCTQHFCSTEPQSTPSPLHGWIEGRAD